MFYGRERKAEQVGEEERERCLVSHAEIVISERGEDPMLTSCTGSRVRGTKTSA